MKKHLLTVIALVAIMIFPAKLFAQNDVMMQAFYWDVPVDEVNKNGNWWDNLSAKAAELKTAGITGLWLPSPSKGNWGITDNGYGIYDHYDLGNYNQKGTVETRFGSKAELLNMINIMHQTPRIDVYADIVMNHMYSESDAEEVNPAVKAYVMGEAHNEVNVPYDTNLIKWVIPNAAPGDYYIQIKGYGLNWNASSSERAYNLNINWTGAATVDPGTNWESEPNNGSGNTNNYPASGYSIRGHADYKGDIDEFKVTVTQTHDIVIRLEARRETQNPYSFGWADQKNGYYPVAVWYNGSNLATTTLQARTNTGIKYVTHTQGEPNYTWNYTHFHPVDQYDWLGGYGGDEIIPNTMMFGLDFNTYDPVVQTRFNDWGIWLSNLGFDGFRLDFVRGFQESFVTNWAKSLPKLNGQQRFIVGEYWGSDYRIKDWVNTIAAQGATVKGFDFPLKSTLTSMCNSSGTSFNMSWLNHAGMVRNSSGNSLSGVSVVTFVDNHDSGKEEDKWVHQDHKLGYAYMLTHEGRPCLFYPHYYAVTQKDNNNSAYTTTAPTSLKGDINFLIGIRKNYLGGIITVLTENGNPYPAADVQNVYVARRQGNGTKGGAIIVLNNHTATKGIWVTTSATGFEDLANKRLINPQTNEIVTVQADGRAYFSAPSRGYSIWLKETDYTPATLKASMAEELNLSDVILIPDTQLSLDNISPEAQVTIHNISGMLLYKNISNIKNVISNLPAGTYIATVNEGEQNKTFKFIVE